MDMPILTFSGGKNISGIWLPSFMLHFPSSLAASGSCVFKSWPVEHDGTTFATSWTGSSQVGHVLLNDLTFPSCDLKDGCGHHRFSHAD